MSDGVISNLLWHSCQFLTTCETQIMTIMKMTWQTERDTGQPLQSLAMLCWFVPECDIRENFDTNECTNIFVSTNLHEWISEYIHTNFFDTNECPNKYSYWKLHEYSNIFEYSSRFYTLKHSPTNVRIYSYKQIWHKRMSEYIRIENWYKLNKYLCLIYSKIWILQYIRHTLVKALEIAIILEI